MIFKTIGNKSRQLEVSYRIRKSQKIKNYSTKKLTNRVYEH